LACGVTSGIAEFLANLGYLSENLIYLSSLGFLELEIRWDSIPPGT
jgi:hypothetical protein